MDRAKILSSADIIRLVSMTEAITAVEHAFRDLSMGSIQMPIRAITDLGVDNLSLFINLLFQQPYRLLLSNC